MFYSFPTIQTIEDVLPVIEGRTDFIVADKGAFTVVNYVVEMNDTFPPVIVNAEQPDVSNGVMGFVVGELEDVDAAIRRECRGLIFCNKTRKLIRRPYHKFFNYGQKEEVLPSNVDFSKAHSVLEKLDGSMIAPFRDHAGKIWWGTKMVAESFHDEVERFVSSRPKYIALFNECQRYGMTPIFEYVAPTNRIVVNYQEENLILTAIREIASGEYVDYNTMIRSAAFHNVPYVRAFNFDNFAALEAYIESLEDAEGVVIRFDNGHMVKLKGPWYVQIHKVKDRIVYDRNIVEIILDENLDDLLPFLMEEERTRIMQFQTDFWSAINSVNWAAMQIFDTIQDLKMDRKTFALGIATWLNPAMKALIFKHFDDTDGFTDTVINTIRGTLTHNGRFEAIREQWFPEVRYNA